MKYYDLPPLAPALMESTRAIGYSTESAIADIIDNSVTAFATKIDIDFYPAIGNPYVYILDNGFGMDKDRLIDAMKYGSTDPLETRGIEDLGRYGLGMKTASTSQCKILTVASKKDGTISAARWDLNYIRECKEWSLIILDESEIKGLHGYEKLSALNSGTLVIWEDLDKMVIGESDPAIALGKKMHDVREHISLVFHRYLSGEQGLNKIEISMNGNPVEPKDPFLIKKSQQLFDDEVININGEKVVITPYILPHVSKLTKEELDALGGKEGLRRQQGFYVYRNKRLIIWGDWFRLMRKGDLSKLARVKVDIPNSLDDLWTLDIKKSAAIPPEEVRKNLSIVIDKICAGSKRTWEYRGKKETSDKVTHVWNRIKTRDESIYYEVNAEHPFFEQFKCEHPDASKDLDKILKEISVALPLNSLYIDLTNDEKFFEDTDLIKKDVLNSFKEIVLNYNGDKSKFIDSLKITEPFSLYWEDIQLLIDSEDLI